jgi:HEPN domain-containing protein
MPQNDRTWATAEDWLKRAHSDLALSKIARPDGVFLEDLCFHAQQAAEKALKALFVQRGWTFHFTHDLQELIADLVSKGVSIPGEISRAGVLSAYAKETRYPGFGDPIEIIDHQRAVALADAIVAWVEQLVRG